MISSRSLRSRIPGILACGVVFLTVAGQSALQAQMPEPEPAPPSPKQSLKQMFAGTVAAVLQGTGAGLAVGLTQALSGAIQGWFNKPGQVTQANAMTSQPGGMMPDNQMATGMPSTISPVDGMSGMETTTYPPTDMSGVSGTMPQASDGTGIPATPYSPDQPHGTAGAAAVYAGLAFEVHALALDGSATPVDPATHTFATGDRFVIHYRPSLPGQVTIFNVNPLGQEKQIDTVNVAAGELTRLGPYEFRDNSGDEQLRLILSPCRTDQLIATTRDIVRVEEMQPVGAVNPSAAGETLGLAECGTVMTRSTRPQTRDIAKVESEGGTMFALDPVSSQEVATGQVVPREITLAFRHR